MAVPARNEPQREHSPAKGLSKEEYRQGERSLMFKPVQVLAAQLIGRGMRPSIVARKLEDQIAPRAKEGKSRSKQARTRVRAWLKREAFRDLVYEYSLIDLEADIPAIFQGVSKKAQAGRVDAAKLILEVTGRHSDKGEAPPAVVQISFPGLPRPVRQAEGAEVVDVDVDEED